MNQSEEFKNKFDRLSPSSQKQAISFLEDMHAKEIKEGKLSEEERQDIVQTISTLCNNMKPGLLMIVWSLVVKFSEANLWEIAQDELK
jgi:hypothetical protein